MNDQTIWDKLQAIDPRYLYVALIVFIVVPLLAPISLPNIPSQPTRMGYETVERVASERPGDLVLIASDWSASTHGESHWQSIAALRQIMMRHLRFDVVSLDPQNSNLMIADINQVSDELTAAHKIPAPYVYGKDYCLWGYRPSTAVPQFLKGIANDIPGTVHADYRGNPIASLPCMRGVRNTRDVSMVLLITPTSVLDTFLQFVGGIPLVYFPTSVMAPEGYPYLDSHQIGGMVTGVKGAGDYEQLEGVKGFGYKIATALSLVYFLILLLILVGNVAYYVGKRRAATR